MPHASSSRRRFLRSLTAVAAGGACVTLGAPAHAITERSASDYGRVLENACGRSGEHARLMAETADALGLPLDDPRLQPVLQRMTCPVCGCPVLPPAGSGASSPF